MKYLFSILILFSFIFIVNSQVSAYSFNPPNQKTGAPGEGNCSDCHSGNSLNTVGGSLVLTVPNTYVPGMVYDIVVKLERDSQKRWGFEMTALTNSNTRAGTFSATDANTQAENENNRQYIKQTTVGTAQGTQDMHSWRFRWTAPSTNVGPITFYAAGNAADGTFGTNNDYIYTQKTTSEVLTHGVSISSDEVRKETTDANIGVEYRLKLTNTGNVQDTIQLSSSAEIGKGGSVLGSFKKVNSQDIPTPQLEITSNPGETKDVIFIASGDLLTKPGTYPIVVTASSKGDSSKTAKITTITTISAVYDVSIEGIGELTQEIADVSIGVNYTVRITNTGNDRDTIILTTSGDITANLSTSSIILNSGAFRDVSISIPNEALSKAGEYEVKILATSSSDISKTDEILTKTIVLPVYDVSIKGIGDLTSETSDASNGVSYKFTISNTGNTDDTIDLSTSGDVLGTLSQTSVSLASGASTEITLTLPGSALSKAGDYSVKVAATSQGDSDKSSEVSTKTKILPVYGVNIEGIGDLTSETSDASNGVSYKFTISNTGNTEDTIDLSTSGDVLGTLSQTSVSLASGASTEITLTLPGSALSKAGDYSVKVTATSQGDIERISELTTTTTILPVYGVSLDGVDNLTTETTDAGDGINYKITVKNMGNTDDTINLTISGDAISTLSQSSVSLLSGESTEITLTVSGNALTIAGDYEVSITATSVGDNTITDKLITTTTILPVYGVVVEGIGDLTTKTTNVSNGVSYSLTIINTGNTADTFVLTSSDNTATIDQPIVTIRSNASTEVILTIPASTLAIAGDYSVIVTVTSQGNNTLSATISTITSILPTYDISISGLMRLDTDTSDAEAGIQYKFTVKNKGNTDDVINLLLSDDELATLNQNSISLASGTSQEVILTISPEALSTAGEFEVSVTATSNGDPEITAETTISTSIDPVYEVVIEGVDQLVGSTADILEGVSYELTLTNIGNIEDTILLGSSAEIGIEGSVLGSFIDSTNQDISTSQVEITLDPGASVTVTFTTAGDFFTKPGNYEIIVTATSLGDDTKTDEIKINTTIEPVVWDLNADGIVNILDLVTVTNQFWGNGRRT